MRAYLTIDARDDKSTWGRLKANLRNVASMGRKYAISGVYFGRWHQFRLRSRAGLVDFARLVRADELQQFMVDAHAFT
jgi:hypothetical protein